MKDLSNISVVLPSLDPDEKLHLVIDGLLEYGFSHIILVNDGSKKENLHYFEEEAAAHPDVITLLHHEVNKGKGAALKNAFNWFLKNRPEGYARYHCPDCGHSYEELMNYSDIITGAYVDTTEILKQGIDTSKWNHVGYQPDGQLNPLDWEALKAAGVEFVILKAGSTYGIDETFERDYLEAKAAGLEVGAYFYAYATTPEETLPSWRCF